MSVVLCLSILSTFIRLSIAASFFHLSEHRLFAVVFSPPPPSSSLTFSPTTDKETLCILACRAVHMHFRSCGCFFRSYPGCYSLMVSAVSSQTGSGNICITCKQCLGNPQCGHRHAAACSALCVWLLPLTVL